MATAIIPDSASLAQEIIRRVEIAAHEARTDTMALGADVAAIVATWFAAGEETT